MQIINEFYQKSLGEYRAETEARKVKINQNCFSDLLNSFPH